jgi:DNA-binding MarR family transcriptional regulator
MVRKSTSDLSQELFQTLKQFSRVKWEARSFEQLKPSECELLGTLYLILNNGEKAIPASALSQELNITPAAVTHLLNPLDENGFIKRHKDPDDRRYVLISLTSKGKKFTESLLEDETQKLELLVKHLGKENSKTLLRLMSTTINFFSKETV